MNFDVRDETNFQYVRIIPFGPDEDDNVADTIFAGFNLEDFTTAENITRDSNIFFKGIYDGQRIEGRANILFYYDLIDKTGLVFVNLVIDNLDTLACFGFSNEEWGWFVGFPMARTLKAVYKLI